MTGNVILQERSPNLLIRILYFILVGIWFSGIWATVAWVLCVTIIGLPFGLWMLNRLPQVTTLKAQTNDVVVLPNGQVFQKSKEQLPFILRAIYFVLIGWWFSALWLAAAWALCTVIIGIPFGFWMFNRVPAIITLAR
jgi:uncharacterized membrane protein YccF (DUF307 family)